MPLTNLAVQTAKPKAKAYKLTDANGMFLQITPAGGKYWRYKYRYAGKEKLLALGVYPAVTLQEAREKRLTAQRMLEDGLDPSAQKQEIKRLAVYKAENSFEAIAKEWHANNSDSWTPDHGQRLWRRLKRHALPCIGSKPIADIKPLELLAMIRKVEVGNRTETAHRVLQACSSIFRYAVLTGRIESNPASDLNGALKPHKAENYPTLQPRELPAFIKILNTSDISPLNRLAIHFLMLTFVRQGELRQAQWAHIDFENREWRIPAEIMKMRERHIVPLSRQGIDTLCALHALNSHSAYLFPSQQRRRHPIMSENTINKVLQGMGYKNRLVAHGFRALASTVLNEQGFRPDIIEKQLAHAERNKVRAAYNRAEYLQERAEMMQFWADYLEKAGLQTMC